MVTLVMKLSGAVFGIGFLPHVAGNEMLRPVATDSEDLDLDCQMPILVAGRNHTGVIGNHRTKCAVDDVCGQETASIFVSSI